MNVNMVTSNTLQFMLKLYSTVDKKHAVNDEPELNANYVDTIKMKFACRLTAENDLCVSSVLSGYINSVGQLAIGNPTTKLYPIYSYLN